MTTRDKLNQEMIESVINILEAEDVLTPEEAAALIQGSEMGDAIDVAADARGERGAPGNVPGTLGRPASPGNGNGNGRGSGGGGGKND